jgi:hypothetical protein
VVRVTLTPLGRRLRAPAEREAGLCGVIEDHMLGQFFELPWAWAPIGAVVPFWAPVELLVVVLAGALLVVDAALDVVAALAIAAPPPATVAVIARAVSSGLIRWYMVHLLCWCGASIARAAVKFVGDR